MESQNERRFFSQNLIELIAELKPHDHLCLIYESREEWLGVVVPFIVSGLARGEKCIYVVDANTAQQIRAYFKSSGLDVTGAEEDGRFKIIHHRESYTKEGFFDPDLMIRLLISETKQALEEGYAALRVTGEMSWALKNYSGTERVLEYESKLNRDLFPHYPCVAICQYDRWKFDPETIKGVVLTHPLLIRGGQIYRNFYYIEPEEYLNHKKAEREVQHWLNNLERERKTQESLRESAEKYRTLFEQSVAGIYLHDRHGNIIDVNDEFCRQIHYSRYELLNLTVFDLYPETKDSQSLDPANILKQWKNWQPREKHITEIEHKRKDGTVYKAQVTAGVVQFGKQELILSFVLDITAQQEAATKIEETVNRFNALLNYSDSLITIFDEKGKYVELSTSAASFIGYPVDEIRGKTFSQILPKPIAEEFCKTLKQLKNVRQPIAKTDIIKIENKKRIFESSLFPIGKSEQGAELFCSIARDITDHKEMEDNIKSRLSEMEMLQKISAVLRTAENMEEMLTFLLDETLSVLKTGAGAICIYHPKKERLRFAATRGWFSCLESALIHSGEGIAGKVFESEQIIVSRELASDPRMKYRDVTPEGWGGACFPLYSSKQVVGTLFISVPLPREITPEEIRLLSSLSEMAGTAIHRISLYENVKRRLKQLQTTRAIDLAISSSLDLQHIMDVMLEHITAEPNVSQAAFFLLHPHLKWFEYASGKGFEVEIPKTLRFRPGETSIGKAAIEKRTIIVHAEKELLAPFGMEDSHTAICVPLVSKGLVTGVLVVYMNATNGDNREWLDFLEMLAGQAGIAIDNARLFEESRMFNLQISQAYDATIESLARFLELRDYETENHCRKVADQTLKLARAMGIEEEKLVHIYRGAILHDIGKISIPDNILLKPGALTKEDWMIIKQHPRYAHDLLASVEYLRPALNIPYYHHEKWDGTGYPLGLKQAEIPLEARIFAVVDVYDALTSDRPYRRAWKPEEARTYIYEQSGKHFDPQVVETFLKV